MNDPNIAAADALATLDSAPAVQSANDMAEAFDAAGERIARSLEGAAKRGELSFNSLAETVLSDLARLAVSELVEAPLNSLVSNLTGALGKAVGGSTTVNMNISGAQDVQSFQRSQSQITANLARAVNAGAKRL